MSINPEKKMNFTGIGKYLLRKSFEGDYLPHEILYREKAAFSDAVGHSVVDNLKAYAEELYSDSDLLACPGEIQACTSDLQGVTDVPRNL